MTENMHVLSLRGGLVETTHTVRAVAIHLDEADREEQVLCVGPPVKSTWRSAGKPLQLWASLEALQDPELPAEALAIGASSHSGQPFHLAQIRALMARLGVAESALGCGAEPPAHAPTWQACIAAGQPALAIHNDCSGKHAFMLAAADRMGGGMDYRHREHPLQQRIAALVSQWCGEVPGMGVDGCGVPTFHLSITGMARAWARLAVVTATGQWRSAPDPRGQRIGQALAAHPRLTSGDGRIDLAIARRATEPFIGKIGARGVFCIALPQRRVGIAIKVLCGSSAALAVSIPEIVHRVAPGALADQHPWPWSELRDVVGNKVGAWVVAAPGRV